MKFIECKNKKDLVNEIDGYIKDSVNYIGILKIDNKWNYTILEFSDDTEDLTNLDPNSIVLNGFDDNLYSKKSVSQAITYFRLQKEKQTVNNSQELTEDEVLTENEKLETIKEVELNKNFSNEVKNEEDNNIIYWENERQIDNDRYAVEQELQEFL